MIDKRKRAAAAELDEVLDALIQAIPPERYGEMRAVLREALVRTSRKAAMARPPAPTPDDMTPWRRSPISRVTPCPRRRPPPASVPRKIADSIILAANRRAEASTASPLSRLRGERGLGVRVVRG